VVDLCAKHEISATFFEIAFIMTCLHFQSMKCEVVVLEVGMGGRYDASNVISSYMSVVTSIGEYITIILLTVVLILAASCMHASIVPHIECISSIVAETNLHLYVLCVCVCVCDVVLMVALVDVIVVCWQAWIT
jgi:hypothetical protein